MKNKRRELEKKKKTDYKGLGKVHDRGENGKGWSSRGLEDH